MSDIKLSAQEFEPASGNKAKQLVVFLHGLGANGADLINLAEEFSETLPDAHFVSPNAPFACDMSPFGYQWFSLREWTPKSMLKGAENAAPILNNFIDGKLKELKLKDENLAFIGFSQGTMMALYVAMRRKKTCAAVVGYSGAFLDDGSKAISKPPVCLIHGTHDMVVPFIAMQDAENKISALGIKIETHQRPFLGHGIDNEGILAAKKFLYNQIVKGKE